MVSVGQSHGTRTRCCGPRAHERRLQYFRRHPGSLAVHPARRSDGGALGSDCQRSTAHHGFQRCLSSNSQRFLGLRRLHGGVDPVTHGRQRLLRGLVMLRDTCHDHMPIAKVHGAAVGAIKHALGEDGVDELLVRRERRTASGTRVTGDRLQGRTHSTGHRVQRAAAFEGGFFQLVLERTEGLVRFGGLELGGDIRAHILEGLAGTGRHFLETNHVVAELGLHHLQLAGLHAPHGGRKRTDEEVFFLQTEVAALSRGTRVCAVGLGQRREICATLQLRQQAIGLRLGGSVCLAIHAGCGLDEDVTRTTLFGGGVTIFDGVEVGAQRSFRDDDLRGDIRATQFHELQGHGLFGPEVRSMRLQPSFQLRFRGLGSGNGRGHRERGIGEVALFALQSQRFIHFAGSEERTARHAANQLVGQQLLALLRLERGHGDVVLLQQRDVGIAAELTTHLEIRQGADGRGYFFVRDLVAGILRPLRQQLLLHEAIDDGVLHFLASGFGDFTLEGTREL